MTGFSEAFSQIASAVSRWTGRPLVFLFCCAVVVVWGATGLMNGPGNPDATTVFPQAMKFDYIRVFKSKAAPPLRAKGSLKPDVPPLKNWEPKK